MEVEWYVSESGETPFLDWIGGLDNSRKATVQRYVHRVADGASRKNVRALGDGVWEIKVAYTHGAMRVYFGKTNGLLILLGGSKGSQRSDIKRARWYWSEYVKKKQVL